MTKRSVAVAFAGVLALSVSACGGGSSSSDSSKSDTSAASSKSGDAKASGSAAAGSDVNAKDPKRDANADLVIWADGTAAPVVSKLAKQFADENDVKVSVQVSTDVRGNYGTAFKAGQAPDVIVGAHDWMGELVSNGSVAPVQIPANVASGFNKEAIAATKYNNQSYGVPYAVENMALVRNTDMVKDAPKTIDELVATGQKVVDEKKATNVLSLEMGKQGDAYHGIPFLPVSAAASSARRPTATTTRASCSSTRPRASRAPTCSPSSARRRCCRRTSTRPTVTPCSPTRRRRTSSPARGRCRRSTRPASSTRSPRCPPSPVAER